MQKLSTVRISMGLIWVLLLQENALFYGKSVFATSCYLALLSRKLEFSPEHNIARIVFKSCHSDQMQNRCKPCKRLDTAVFLCLRLQFKLHFCSRNAVKSHGFPKKSHEKITRIGCGSEPSYTKLNADRAVARSAFIVKNAARINRTAKNLKKIKW